MPQHAALALLADVRFRNLWLAGGALNTMRWLEVLAISVYVFDRTGSALTVAVVQLLRWLPLVLFGGLIGAYAEHGRRKPLLLAGFALAASVSLLLGWLAAGGQVALWQIGAGSFLMGVLWSGDYALRRTLVGDVAGPDRLATAMVLDSITMAATRMIGPLVGGLLIGLIGLHGAYFAGVALYGSAVLLLLRLREPVPRRVGDQPPRAGAWREGLSYLRKNRLIAAVLFITVVFNLFGGPYVAFVPVIGKQVLDLTPTLVGLLLAADGFGAFCGAMLATALGERLQAGRVFVCGTGLFLLAVLLFALSDSYLMSILLLLAAGVGFSGFSGMQSGLVLRHSAPHMRRRMMGLLATCIGCSPIGMLLLGALAEAVGAAVALRIVAVAGLVALILAAVIWRDLHTPRPAV